MFTTPITYKLADERGGNIKGGFYADELQKAKYGEVFPVKKIIKEAVRSYLLGGKDMIKVAIPGLMKMM